MFGFENQCSRNVPHNQPKYPSLQKTHHVLVELACHFGEIACLSMHVPKHPDDRSCQLVVQDDTDLWLFTMVLKRVGAVNLGWGIDWPVNPQIKLARARLHLPTDKQPMI